MLNGKIDLRSDTITHPPPAMMEAMWQAPLGDDAYGEDPTVNALEAKAAQLLGKEAAVFVPSGTMGNLSSILAHCRRGDEIILGDKAHIFRFEQGSVAAVGGLLPHLIPNQADGTLRLEDIEAAIRPNDQHHPRTRLIGLENTHNAQNGAPLSVEYTQSVRDLANKHGLRLHLDGARIFNAAAAQNVSARELVAPVDSLTFCLSKGLCCPVGSVVCGSADFIYQVRRERKVLGGGMRQAGIIAAAGIYALENMIDRLADDNGNAKRLAKGLAEIPGIDIDPSLIRTNIVFFRIHDDVPHSAEEISERLQHMDIVLKPRPNRFFRAVAHYWISTEDINTTLRAFREVL